MQGDNDLNEHQLLCDVSLNESNLICEVSAQSILSAVFNCTLVQYGSDSVEGKYFYFQVEHRRSHVLPVFYGGVGTVTS